MNRILPINILFLVKFYFQHIQEKVNNVSITSGPSECDDGGCGDDIPIPKAAVLASVQTQTPWTKVCNKVQIYNFYDFYVYFDFLHKNKNT